MDFSVDPLVVPVPPLYGKQGLDGLIVETFPDGSCRVADHDGVGRHIFCDDSLSADDGTVTNGDAGEDGGPLANPYIVADSDISMRRRVPGEGCRIRETPAQHVERIGGDPI